MVCRVCGGKCNLIRNIWVAASSYFLTAES